MHAIWLGLKARFGTFSRQAAPVSLAEPVCRLESGQRDLQGLSETRACIRTSSFLAALYSV